jgi:putative oxidoreductase
MPKKHREFRVSHIEELPEEFLKSVYLNHHEERSNGMEILFLIGRIIVGLFYLNNAFNHFARLEMMAGYTQSKGVPAPKAAVIVTGILLLIGGLSILTGLYPTIGVAALVVFFLPVAIVMHGFWNVTDPNMKMMEMIQFMKDIALMGSALMFLAVPQPWAYSLGN